MGPDASTLTSEMNFPKVRGKMVKDGVILRDKLAIANTAK